VVVEVEEVEVEEGEQVEVQDMVEALVQVVV
jgi:hypothetical protein